LIPYAIRRLATAALIIVLAVVVLFCMIHMVPGNPANVLLGPRATPEMKAILAARLHLDQPMYWQIYYFVVGLLHGDLGLDLVSQRPVLTMLLERAPSTIQLVLSSLLISLLGIPIGVYAAIQRDRLFDHLSGVVSVALLAVPSIVVALYLILIFAVSLKWLPAIAVGEGFWGTIRHLILPSVAIGVGWIGYVARLVRSSMIEALHQNHVRTARSFGLAEGRIVRRYALRIALPPTLTILGVGISYMLSTAVIIEVIFARPGIGKMMFDGVISRNYPVVMGAVLFSTIVIVLATTITDVMNAILDPRVRSASKLQGAAA
jgi:peptide/nickel transport system permease protein